MQPQTRAYTTKSICYTHIQRHTHTPPFSFFPPPSLSLSPFLPFLSPPLSPLPSPTTITHSHTPTHTRQSQLRAF